MDIQAGLLEHLRERIGVSRIANVTGLDRIGFAVAAAIRPLSRNITVSFGKGADFRQASLSAMMESAELHFSETPPGPLQTGTFRNLRAAGAVDPLWFERLAPGPENLWDVTFDWIAAEELGTGSQVLVPWLMVSMDYSVEARTAPRHLKFGATGLAAGFEAPRAILHGLCEVIERDAHQAWNLADDEVRAQSLVDQGSIGAPEITRLIAMVRAAGLELMIWDMTADNGIACYLAEIFDPVAEATTAYVQGAAAGLSPAEALHKAIAEAIQIRLTYISGSRDDLDWSDYGARYEATVANRRHIAAKLPARRRMPVEPPPPLSLADALGGVRRKLAAAGYDRIFCVRLTEAAEAVQVVKVIVPALRDIRDVPVPAVLNPEPVPA